MDYQFILAGFADWLMVILAAYFGFIAVFGDRQDKKHAAILCIASIAACVRMHSSVGHDIILTRHDHSVMFLQSGMWDTLTAAALSICMLNDKKAAYQALLLLIMWPVTGAMVYELQIGQSAITGFVYIYYTQILITIGAMQMAISYDGFTIAVGNARSICERFSAICSGHVAGDTSSNAEEG